MKILLVINPIAGGTQKDAFLDNASQLCSRYGFDIEVYKTTGKGDAEAIDKQLEKFDPDRVACAGGDGTVAMVARSLKFTGIPLGIIPLGSANGMATELGVPDDEELAFQDIIISKHIADMDLIKVNDAHYCMHIGDVGINAYLVKKFSEDERRGFFGYAKHFLEALQVAKKIGFDIKTDAENWQDEAFMCAIANARKYGTGVVINRKGNPFDGKFELVLAKSKAFGDLVGLGLTRIDPDIGPSLPIKVISCTEAEVKLDRPILFQIDGETLGEIDYFKAEICPGAVRFITHAENDFIDE